MLAAIGTGAHPPVTNTNGRGGRGGGSGDNMGNSLPADACFMNYLIDGGPVCPAIGCHYVFPGDPPRSSIDDHSIDINKGGDPEADRRDRGLPAPRRHATGHPSALQRLRRHPHLDGRREVAERGARRQTRMTRAGFEPATYGLKVRPEFFVRATRSIAKFMRVCQLRQSRAHHRFASVHPRSFPVLGQMGCNWGVTSPLQSESGAMLTS